MKENHGLCTLFQIKQISNLTSIIEIKNKTIQILKVYFKVLWKWFFKNSWSNLNKETTKCPLNYTKMPFESFEPDFMHDSKNFVFFLILLLKPYRMTPNSLPYINSEIWPWDALEMYLREFSNEIQWNSTDMSLKYIFLIFRGGFYVYCKTV